MDILYKTFSASVISYTSVYFTLAQPPAINKLQMWQNKSICNATGASWYNENSDLHRDVQLSTIVSSFKKIPMRIIVIAILHYKSLVVKAIDYFLSPYTLIGRGVLRCPHRP